MRIDVCVYLNRILVQDLSALVGGGYLESIQFRVAHDSTETNKLSRDHKGTLTYEDKRSNNDKDKNIANNYSNQDINDYYGSLEGRSYIRNEETNKKIFTSFFYLEQVIDMLVSSNIINSYEKCYYNSICWGELVELKGRVLKNPLLAYLNSLVNLIDAYGAKELDKILEGNRTEGSLNFSIIQKLCIKIIEEILRNNTQEIIVVCEDFKVVLSCNINFFEDKNANIYDFLGADLRIIMKVLKKVEIGSFDLLRKTGNEEYTRKVINSFKPYLDLLKEKGIVVPNENDGIVKGNIVHGIPLGMYV